MTGGGAKIKRDFWGRQGYNIFIGSEATEKQKMKTGTEREADFRKDFKALMEKHKASFDLVDYNENSGTQWISMVSEWDDELKQTAQYTEFWL